VPSLLLPPLQEKKIKEESKLGRWMRERDADGECAALNHDPRTRQKWSHGNYRWWWWFPNPNQWVQINKTVDGDTRPPRAAAWTLGLDFLDVRRLCLVHKIEAIKFTVAILYHFICI
jgi:hypothetical protein